MDEELGITKREMSVTTRWILSGMLGIMATAAAFGSYYMTDVAGDIAVEKDKVHNSDIYAHPAAFREWRKFQIAETDRIIKEIQKR